MKKFNNIFKKYPITAAFLFGSRAKNRISGTSDYDFAVQLNDNLSRSDYSNIKVNLITDLIHELQNNSVDLVILNEAPLLLKFEIYKNGSIIFDKNPKKRVSQIFDTIKQHLDWDYFQKKMSKSLINRVAKEGLNV